MTSQGRLLEFPQHHEILQNFYNSDMILRSRQRRLKFMTRFFSSVLERMQAQTVLNELTIMQKKKRHLILLLKSMIHLILAQEDDGGKAGRQNWKGISLKRLFGII